MVLATAATLSPTFPITALAEPVTFDAKDGVKIYGDFQRAKGQSRATILLFHMAGSNKSEYAPLAPVLNEAGFSTLAIDQRSGGSLWGEDNQTASNARVSTDFADALPDLEAAISYGSIQHSGPVAVWGSSYSSALVFIAAARHPEVKALLAFSPARPNSPSQCSLRPRPMAVRYQAVRHWQKRSLATERFSISRSTACTDRQHCVRMRTRKVLPKTGSM